MLLASYWPSAPADTGFLLGCMLLAALIGGSLSGLLRLPRVVGYLLAGIALRLILTHTIQWLESTDPSDTASLLSSAKKPLSVLKDLALGIILFSIGRVFERRQLRSIFPRAWRVVLAESGLTFILVATAVALALLLTTSWAAWQIVGMSLILAAAAIETAPAATLFVLQEYEAKGPSTDTILATLGLNNLLCIAAFSTIALLLATQSVFSHEAITTQAVILSLLTATLGSLVLGTALGLLLTAFASRLSTPHTVTALLALTLVLSAAEKTLIGANLPAHSFFLTMLTAGAVFWNIAVDPVRLDAATRTVAAPILVAFFVIAGFSLDVSKLSHIGLVGLAYVAARTTGKLLGAHLGTRWSNTRTTTYIKPDLGQALLCQAALILGWVTYVSSHWDDQQALDVFITTALSSVVLFETVGALFVKFTVVRHGEVKAITLMRRSPDASASTFAAALARAFQSLLRLLPFISANNTHHTQALTVRHVMRTNVKCIPAAATFDDVMRFVEQSTYSHFPVINPDRTLVGMIHFADLRELLYNPELSDLITAADLASTDTRAVLPTDELSSLASSLDRADLGLFPVIDAPTSREVLGIVEQRDILHAMHDASRTTKRTNS